MCIFEYPNSDCDLDAQKKLVKKRQGQWISLAQIIDWLQQESVFYKQNHGDAMNIGNIIWTAKLVEEWIYIAVQVERVMLVEIARRI